MIGPIPVASIGSGSRSASSSVLVSNIVVVALSHLDVVPTGAIAITQQLASVDSTLSPYLSLVILL